jgi:hypothetical protein
LVATLLLAIAFVAACGSDGSDTGATDTPAAPTADVTSTCARPVPALTTEPVTKERLQAAIDKMGEVKAAAEAGDQAAANAAFAGDTHTVTHDIDPPLRAADPLLAADLCASIVLIEQAFGAGGDLEAIAPPANIAAGLLGESGRALGLFD